MTDLKIGEWVKHEIKEEGLVSFLRVERFTNAYIFFHDGTHAEIDKGLNWLEQISDKELARLALKGLKAEE